MTSLLEDELDNPEDYWYARAKLFYEARQGDPTEYMHQARLWLNDYDFGRAEIAWQLVDMEHKNREA